MTYVGIILILLYVFIEAKRDAEKYLEGEEIDHGANFIRRAAVVAFITLLAFPDILMFLPYAFLFWAGFDIAWNAFAGKSFWYIGNTATIDKKARKIFGENGGFLYMIVKVALMVGTAILALM